MRPSITIGLLLAALAAPMIGCRDSAPAAPQQALDIRDRSDSDRAGAGNDSGSTTQPTSPTAPAEPAPGPDTAVAPPPAPPTAFALTGVALGVEPGSDTTRTVRLPGVTARLYRVRSVDGTPVAETLVGSATADASGEFAFGNLASAYYRLDVAAPAGGPYVDGSVSIAPPWSAAIGVHVILHRKS